ncbi:histidine ammonia-lyase [Sediminitomix flava]|uniref:Histidine ammonia-lyase n=1 Tax=Sediminitomix flava TaxID=379075 RepID=A0A315ZCD9_SEDFL|nr:histidine ammonia-lyase [Sediminitomix flava]PWJ43246.1 histidine ammonia-lyase [Sediminitomix flava]
MTMSNTVFAYGKDKLSVGMTLDLARGKVKGTLTDEVRAKVIASRKHVEKIVEAKKVVYGVNTGFGPLCTTIISEEDTKELQTNILQSHSVGMGNPVSEEIVKIMMVTKVQALSQGYSGIALETLERILWMLEEEIVPVVPEKGSVGASGDLAPLSHLFLPLIGLGEVYYKGERMETAPVLEKYGKEPIALGPKEGLALINGTQFILSHAVKAVERFHNLLEAADLIGAMSLEAAMGSARPFEAILHEIRPFKGNQHVAERLDNLLKDSEILNSHAECDRVQDPYSLRCMPPVHGASRNAWLHLKEMVEVELNSVTDNPIILDAENTISGGNFHGQPLAMVLDYATLAASELGNISDRRSYLMIEGRYGLPKLLMEDTGINSGFMIPQYTSAALVTENKTLCFPASADSVPTSLGQEDHVSMGSISGRKANEVISNVEKILAVELLYAAQGVDFRRPMKSTKVIEECHNFVREKVAFADKDRIFATDLNVLEEMIHDQSFVNHANKTAEKEGIQLNGKHDELFRIY